MIRPSSTLHRDLERHRLGYLIFSSKTYIMNAKVSEISLNTGEVRQVISVQVYPEPAILVCSVSPQCTNVCGTVDRAVAVTVPPIGQQRHILKRLKVLVRGVAVILAYQLTEQCASAPGGTQQNHHVRRLSLFGLVITRIREVLGRDHLRCGCDFETMQIGVISRQGVSTSKWHGYAPSLDRILPSSFNCSIQTGRCTDGEKWGSTN